jgi:hypothetical protein
VEKPVENSVEKVENYGKMFITCGKLCGKFCETGKILIYFI